MNNEFIKWWEQNKCFYHNKLTQEEAYEIFESIYRSLNK